MSSHIVNVTINGYTSDLGTEAQDMTLSVNRAKAVASILQSQGIDSKRLIINGMGKSNYVASNKTPAGRALNDRVELVYVP